MLEFVLKVSGLGGGVASAAAVAFLAASPVQAASIGVTGAWESETSSEADPADVVLQFMNLSTPGGGTGFLAGYEATSIGDLILQRDDSSSNDEGDVFGYYSINTELFDGSGWKRYQDGQGNVIVFDLDTDATWRRFFDSSDRDTSWAQDANSEGLFEYSGTYTLPDGTKLRGSGILNASASGDAQLFENTQQSTEGSPEVIPLPATVWLLFGASGVLGYFGRRKRSAAA